MALNEKSVLYRDVLQEINAVLPPGIDWKAGAVEYLENVRRNGLGSDVLAKPFWTLVESSGPEAYEEVAHLLGDFVDVFKLLNLRAGSVVLDVACGAGWLAAFWAKLGFKAYGFDICPEFVALARERSHKEAGRTAAPDVLFQVHDIESGPLILPDRVDAAIFESCFHHFYDPIAALHNVGQMLGESGVAVIIEGGNAITSEFREVMVKYRTIERPYTRTQMKKILRAAGMPYFTFFAPYNRWIGQGTSLETDLTSHVDSAFGAQNRCVCARTEAAIRRLVPDWQPDSGVEFSWGVYRDSSSQSMWCGPHAQIRLTSDCDVSIRIQPSKPGQVIVIYSSRRGRLKSDQFLRSTIVQLDSLRSDEILHLCSDHVFSPVWSGETDPRLLSFSIEVMQVTQRD